MKKYIVYCPDCARIVYNYDGKHSTQVNLRCECGRYYRFDPKHNQINRINKPETKTSSGARFW